MNKAQIMDYLEEFEDDEEISINEMMRDIEEAERLRIEYLEEEQHKSGFYAFQDLMDMWRYER